MRNDKTRDTLLIIIGGYLIYLGVTIIQDIMGTSVDNVMFLYLASIFFIAIGGCMVFIKVKAVLGSEYVQEEDSEDDSHKDIDEN